MERREAMTSFRGGRMLRTLAALALVCATMLTFAQLAVAQEPTTSDPAGSDVFATSGLPDSPLSPDGSAAASGATIASDQPDYGPGATVTLTGSGWQAGESVRIVVNDDGLQDQVWQRDVTVTADAEGTIGDVFELPAWFVANYTVTATGESSGVATTTFTDAIVATASVAERAVGRNTTSKTFTFTVNNVSTASEQIRSIRISRPGGHLDITACSTTLSGWSTGDPGGSVASNGSECVITSTAGDATIAANGPSGTFTVTANVSRGDNATGTWNVRVNATNNFTGGGTNATPPLAVPTALDNAAFAYWITSAVVAESAATVGDDCPAAGNSAPAGTQRVIVICGINGVNNNTDSIPGPYTGSSLSGSMIGAAGTLSGGGTFVNTPDAVRVLANWPATIGAAGTNRNIAVHIGSKPPNNARTSQNADFGGYDSRFGTALAVDHATGTFAGTTTLSATLTRTSDNAAVSGKSISFTLDGDSVGSATTNASGVATLTGVSLAGIDAGTYTDAVGASFTTDSTHTGSSDSANLTVNRANTTTTVTCGAGPFTYSGVAQTPCSAQVTGPGGLDEPVSVDYSDNEDAGTASASATYAQTANYNSSSDSKTFVIGKADPTVSITWADATYDGNAHGASVSVSGVGSPAEDLSPPDSVIYYVGSDTTGAELTGAPTDAGTYTVEAKFDGNSNYNPASATKTIEIDRANTSTTVTCGAGPFTYSGSPQTPCSAQVTGPGGLDEPLTVDYSNNTDAGTATASATYAETANYNSSSDSKNFGIDPADTTTETTCTAGPFTFNGSAHTPCSAKVTGPGLNQTLTVTYTDNTNAGTATASATHPAGGNYKSSSDSKTFDIGKATTSTALSCPASVTHTGSAIEPCSAIVTGPAGLNQGVAVDYTNNTDVGTATASASYAATDNYKASSDAKTFTITTACRTAGTFQAPIKEGTRMVVKLGNVIPVKVRLADCNDVLVTGRTLSIRVIAGIVNGDDVSDGSEIIPNSVSAADSTGIMRLVDGNHMYNLATKGLGTGLPYTIVIRDTTTAAWSSAPTVGTAVIEPKK